MRLRFGYVLKDIRDYAAMEIAAGGTPADLVLSALAGDGQENLPKILRRIFELKPAQRDRALAQLALLSGLRRFTERP